jgi:hypothetical protein
MKPWPVLLAAGLTLAVFAWVEFRLAGNRGVPEGAAAYLADCRDAAELIPHTLPGGWIGRDVPVPTAATDLLKPNILISRSYQQLRGDSAVGLLLVQTTNRQDLMQHHPPVCYPNQGWHMIGEEPRAWEVDGLPINGIVYTMRPPGRGDDDPPVRIYNFMMQAGGSTGHGMDALFEGARRGAGDHFGPGQVQVLFYGGMDEAGREATFAAAIRAMRPAIDAILRPIAATDEEPTAQHEGRSPKSDRPS